MSIETQELIDVCEQLPVTARAKVADFARFLLSKNEDAAGERMIPDARPRPTWEEFVRAALAEGNELADHKAMRLRLRSHDHARLSFARSK